MVASAAAGDFRDELAGVSPARSAAAGVEAAARLASSDESAGADAAIRRADRFRIAARFDVALAQMDQMALGLQLAAAAQIGVADAQAGEHVLADDTTWWLAMMPPYSTGKTSSVRRNSSRLSSSGTAGAGLAPVARARRARRQILKRSADRRAPACARHRRSSIAAVGDERLQAGAENPLQIRGQRFQRRMHPSL